jgi:hypothetical protein
LESNQVYLKKSLDEALKFITDEFNKMSWLALIKLIQSRSWSFIL